MEHQLYFFVVVKANGSVVAQDVIALLLPQSALAKILKMEKHEN